MLFFIFSSFSNIQELFWTLILLEVFFNSFVNRTMGMPDLGEGKECFMTDFLNSDGMGSS